MDIFKYNDLKSPVFKFLIKKEGSIVLGSPASDISSQRRSMAVYKNLPELRSRLSDLEKIVEELRRKISED